VTTPPAGETGGAPIFVVGNGRSGTSLMRLMLSAHPRIYVCHETWFYFWEEHCPASFSGDEFLHYFFQTFNFRWLRLGRAEIRAGLPSPLSRHRIGEAFREVMRRKAASYGRFRYGDKSPPHTRTLKQIYRDFPDARVIHMVRDPRTNHMSMTRMPFGARSAIANAYVYESVRRDVRSYRSLLRVRLEDLEEDPRAVMHQVLDFVGEDWDEAVLEHWKHLPDLEDQPPFPWLSRAQEPVSRPSRGYESLPPAQTRLIERICRGAMQAWGYTPAQLQREPDKFDLLVEAASEIPPTIAYARAFRDFLKYNDDPAHWDWDDPERQRLYRRINPEAWKLYPGFVEPKSPPYVD
jgi:hypothetical protein